MSQTTGGTTMRTLAVFLALPEDLFAAAFGTEWFVDRACPPGSALTDVFATLEHVAMTTTAFPGHAGRWQPLSRWRSVTRIGDMLR